MLPRQDVEGAVGDKSAVRYQNVKMGVEVGEVPEGLNSGHHTDGDIGPPGEWQEVQKYRPLKNWRR